MVIQHCCKQLLEKLAHGHSHTESCLRPINKYKTRRFHKHLYLHSKVAKKMKLGGCSSTSVARFMSTVCAHSVATYRQFTFSREAGSQSDCLYSVSMKL